MILNESLKKEAFFLRGRFGVELEVEGNGLPAMDSPWQAKDDGSLRNGVEYILESPLSLEETKNAFATLRKKFDDVEADVEFSFRTSLHVHLNCLPHSFSFAKKLAYTLFLMEPSLFSFSGEERKHNRFCLGIQDSEGSLDGIENLFSMPYEGAPYAPAIYLPPEKYKYSAINLSTLTRFGSIEVRTMRGTINTTVFNTYIGALDCMYEFAKNAKSVLSIYELASSNPEKFFEEALGKYNKYFAYTEREEELLLQISVLISLPFRNFDGD